MKRTIAAAILSLSVSVLPAYAAEDNNNAAKEASATNAPAAVSDNLLWGENITRTTSRVGRPLSRPAVLPALYASYAALQAFDVYSTRQALGRGAREANPLMTGVVGNTSAFIAVKAGLGVATIIAAERLWKTNKAAAIAVMVASNSVSAIVAARNARTLAQLR